MLALAGKTALITGAAGDIGAAIASRFANEGAIVCLADIDQAGGKALAEKLGAPAFFTPLDVTKEDEWGVTVESVLSRHNRLDILINNAGTLETGTIEDTDLALWQSIQSINATSIFLGCQAAVRTMKQTGGGVIVNMASQAAVRPRPSTLAYSASKAAIVNLTKTVATHCADNNYNIRCNVMMPGAVDTQMIYKNQTAEESDEDFMKGVNARYPLGRMGTADEIANGVVFLASDESQFMTGAQLRIDGGGTI
ncbi:MAG: glucose 1-dehydrogenase [Rhodospirillaceae bacterium]|nr:glucose 1-dehydrogenase [Rhodospirillaceae bacterium]